MQRLLRLGVLVAVLAGCGTATSTAVAGSAQARATSTINSIAILGHSGATGYNSVPSKTGIHVLANSWATGTNPRVRSIYQRLLVHHPRLRGHAFNYAADGTNVDDLARQTSEMLSRARPLPDLVIIMSIDNDMRCDGTDSANYARFARKLSSVLTTIVRRDKGVRIYIPDQAVSQTNFVAAIAQTPKLWRMNVGTGPCDLFTSSGEVRPGAVAYDQYVVNRYFGRVRKVCAAHAGCFTDRGRMQGLQPGATDYADDTNHLLISGLAKEAALDWRMLPYSIRH